MIACNSISYNSVCFYCIYVRCILMRTNLLFMLMFLKSFFYYRIRTSEAFYRGARKKLIYFYEIAILSSSYINLLYDTYREFVSIFFNTPYKFFHEYISVALHYKHSAGIYTEGTNIILITKRTRPLYFVKQPSSSICFIVRANTSSRIIKLNFLSVLMLSGISFNRTDPFVSS